VEVEASSVGELLREVVRRFPELGRHIFDGEGKLLEYLNVYVNEEEIRTLEGLDTPLQEGDEVAIVPAMAGGQGAEVARIR
jgi:MoaD family protein